MSRIFVIAALVVALFSTFHPSNSWAAIPLQDECSAAYDSARSYCSDVVKTDWRYYIIPVASTQQIGPFPSEGAAIAAATAVSWPRLENSGYCSFTFSHVQPDVYPVVYDQGIDVSHGDHALYDTVANQTNTPPCAQSGQSYATLSRVREVTCPERVDLGQSAWKVVYEAGNASTPYCAIGWNKVRKRQCGPTKGNPCDVMTGTKAQSETDYVAAGAFPLRFVRTYDSAKAYQNYFGSDSRQRWVPVGIGWSATYFQTVRYESLAPFARVLASRPDGQLRFFRPSGGDFIADDDESDRLTRLTDSSGSTTGWEYVTSTEEIETYDASGRLVSIRSRGGVTHSLSYASPTDRFPNAVSDSFGRQLTFTYSTSSYPRLSGITLPDGGQIILAYDAKDNLSTVTYPDSRTRTYHYELTDTQQVNLLTGITDENAVRFSTYVYGSFNRVESTEHAGGVERYSFTYNFDGSRVVTDPLNKQRTYGTSVVLGARRTTSSTEHCPGCGEHKAIQYDTDGNVFSRMDFNNNESRFGYDNARNLQTSRTEAFGTSKARTITTSWHSSFRLPDVITEPDRTTDHDYDASSNLTQRKITDSATAATRIWTYTYDTYGRVLTENGPRTDVSDVTTYTYYTCSTGDECGQLASVTNAASQTTTYDTYNTHGEPTQITDANGIVTTLAYDARQRLTSRTTGGETTTLEYWPTGLLKKVTLPHGSFILNTYDAAHRLIKIEDGEGHRIEYTLDAMDNRTAERAYDGSGALTRTHTRVFNTLNQLWKDVNAAGTAAVTTVFGYDANGNPTSIAAPLSRNTTQLYDELNRVKQITDPASGITQFGYDANDNLTSVTDPRSLLTSYEYNGFGDLTELTSPDTGIATSTYDSAGNLATRTDSRSKTGTYSHDALNRVTQIVYPDQTLAFTYDAGTHGKGRLTGAADANHSLAFTYDALGRVTAKGQTVGAVTKSVGYGYTAGNLTSLVTPSGQTITYGYSNGRIASVTLNGSTPILSGVLYEPFGPIAGWTWGDSTLAARTFDQDGKIEALDSAGAKTYAYDDAFRITGITDLDDSSKSWTHGYDALDRLTSAAKSGQTIGYSYDANGNRLTESGTQSGTYTVSGTSNRLSSITGTPARTYSYDAAGSTTGFAGLTFTYSDAGRMASVASASGTTSYVVNALGQRVKKAGPAGTRLFLYDEAGHLIGEYDGAGALIQETVWLGDIPVATLHPNGSGGVNVFYVHADYLNTPRRISRPSDNAIVWRWDSDPFGTSAANEDPDGDSTPFAYNLRFPGQYFDTESGLHYNYFRDYDPAVGRYIESDPIGIAGGLNVYAYVAGNPVSALDPLGLCWSNARAAGHFFFGGGGNVGIDQIGCRSQIDQRVLPELNIWTSRARSAAKAKALAMKCGSAARLALARSVGLDSGIFWIGGFSLRQQGDCLVSRKCAATGVAACTVDSYSFSCSLDSTMHDLFENPSDLDNSARSSNPDFWDSWNYGGTPFYVDGSWSNTVSGGGPLP